MDLIKTIEEDTEVQNYSEDSDAEVEVNNITLQLLFYNDFINKNPVSLNCLVSTNETSSKEKRRI